VAPYSSDRDAQPRLIELHTGEGILASTDMVRFLDSNPNASAHAASDASGVQAPLVPYDRAAWTAGPTANAIGLHIEMCAFAAMSREQWLSEADVTVWIPWLNANRLIRSPASMLNHTAAWVRQMADQFDIPVVKLSAAEVRAGKAGICGHADTSAAFGETDHTDPGPGFPWDYFIALVGGNEEDDLKPDERVALFQIRAQLCGETPDLAKFPGWPHRRYNKPAGNFTLVDYLREIDRQLNSNLDLTGRPGSEKDDLLGHVLSLRADQKAVTVELTDEQAEQINTQVGAIVSSRLDELADRLGLSKDDVRDVLREFRWVPQVSGAGTSTGGQ